MKKVILLFVIIFSYSLNSQELINKLNEKWRWIKYDKSLGLPSNNIIRILEDKTGILWACSLNGFAWFDGYKWNTVHNSKYKFSVSELVNTEPDIVSGIVTNHNSRLAIIRKDTIIVKNIYFKNKFIKIKEVIPFDKNRYLLNIISDKEYGNLCLYNGKNLRYLDKHPKIKLFRTKDRYIYTDKNGKIWLNNQDGLFLFKRNKWVIKIKHNLNEPFNLKNPRVNKKGYGMLGIGFPKELRGFWSLDYSNKLLNKIISSKDFINDLCINDKREFVGCFGTSYLLVGKNDQYQYFENIPSDLESVTNVIFDIKGNLWLLGERGLYLVKLSNNRWNNNYFKELSGRYINEILNKKDTFLFATGDGFYMYKNNKLIYKNEDFTGVTGLNIDKNGNIWLSSGGVFPGIYKFDGNRWFYKEVKSNNNPVFFHKIRKDRNEFLWFLSLSKSSQFSGFGAYQMLKDTFKIWNSSNGLISDRVYDFANDSTDGYWFATLNGLCRFKNGKWTYWNSDNGLKSNLVYTVAVDSNNRVWFADYYGGFGYIDTKDSLKYIDILDDTEIIKVNMIMLDNLSNPWMSSRSGIYYFNNESISPFNNKLGLSTSSTWPLLYYNDKILIGTLGGGVNILSTEERNEPLPKIQINTIAENNGIIHIGWSVFSYYGQLPKEDILIRYKIDDKQWSKWSTIREILLTDLSFGEHNIFLQAKGIFGDYKNTTVKATFNLPYPIYLTPWFLLPAIISLYLISLFIYKDIKRKKIERLKLIEHKEQLEKEVNEKTKALSKALSELKSENTIRQRIEEQLIEAKNNIQKAYYKEKELNLLRTNTFTTISKTFFEPIEAINKSIDQIEYNLQNNNFKYCLEELETIKVKTNMLLDSINDIISVAELDSNKIDLNLKRCNIKKIIGNIIKDYNSQDIRRIINLNDNLDKDEFIIDENYFSKIVSNLLNNAVKFSFEDSNIEIEVALINNYLTIKIKDDGIGIPSEFVDYIFEPFIRASNVGKIEGYGLGLTFVKKAVDLFGGDIICSSVVGEGTVMSVYLPKNIRQI